MPILALAPLLSAFIGAVFTLLATYFTRKVAAALTLGVIFLAVTATFYVAIQLLIVGVAYQISNPILLTYFYVILPSNVTTCFTAMFGAEILAFLYRYHMMFIRTLSAA